MKGLEWLMALGIPQQCMEQKSAVTVNRRRFALERGAGDVVWRVQVDGCWLSDSDGKKVDYAFHVDCPSGPSTLYLVELKGADYKQALQQIEAMLERLSQSPAWRTRPRVRAVAVLTHGRAVLLCQRESERIRQRFGVVPEPRSRQFEGVAC